RETVGVTVRQVGACTHRYLELGPFLHRYSVEDTVVDQAESGVRTGTVTFETQFGVLTVVLVQTTLVIDDLDASSRGADRLLGPAGERVVVLVVHRAELEAPVLYPLRVETAVAGEVDVLQEDAVHRVGDVGARFRGVRGDRVFGRVLFHGMGAGHHQDGAHEGRTQDRPTPSADQAAVSGSAVRSGGVRSSWGIGGRILSGGLRTHAIPYPADTLPCSERPDRSWW